VFGLMRSFSVTDLALMDAAPLSWWLDTRSSQPPGHGREAPARWHHPKEQHHGGS
jgi:hypothetical protein